MVSDSRITYTLRSETTPKTGSNALASIYRRAIERYQEATQVKEAARPGGPDDAKKEFARNVRARAIIPN